MGNDSFAKILEKVAGEFVAQEPKPREVPDEMLGNYASRLTKLGYEFSECSLKILLQYLQGYNLWVCGKVGRGKTFFFDCLNRLRKARDADRIIKLSMIETQGWTMEKAEEWAADYADHDVLIDDVGSEPILNHYGEKVELFPYLLEKRMNRTRCRTHVTTNCKLIGKNQDPPSIAERYGERVKDRIVQMFAYSELSGPKSRRHVTPWGVS